MTRECNNMVYGRTLINRSWAWPRSGRHRRPLLQRDVSQSAVRPQDERQRLGPGAVTAPRGLFVAKLTLTRQGTRARCHDMELAPSLDVISTKSDDKLLS